MTSAASWLQCPILAPMSSALPSSRQIITFPYPRSPQYLTVPIHPVHYNQNHQSRPASFTSQSPLLILPSPFKDIVTYRNFQYDFFISQKKISVPTNPNPASPHVAPESSRSTSRTGAFPKVYARTPPSMPLKLNVRRPPQAQGAPAPTTAPQKPNFNPKQRTRRTFTFSNTMCTTIAEFAKNSNNFLQSILLRMHASLRYHTY